MIKLRDVKRFTNVAEYETEPALFGIFCESNPECEKVWLYLVACVEDSPGVILNMAHQEVTLCNGVCIRVFCVTWRTYVGLAFTNVLIASPTVGDQVKDLILFRIRIDKGPERDESEEPARFGL